MWRSHLLQACARLSLAPLRRVRSHVLHSATTGSLSTVSRGSCPPAVQDAARSFCASSWGKEERWSRTLPFPLPLTVVVSALKLVPERRVWSTGLALAGGKSSYIIPKKPSHQENSPKDLVYFQPLNSHLRECLTNVRYLMEVLCGRHQTNDTQCDIVVPSVHAQAACRVTAD